MHVIYICAYVYRYTCTKIAVYVNRDTYVLEIHRSILVYYIYVKLSHAFLETLFPAYTQIYIYTDILYMK